MFSRQYDLFQQPLTLSLYDNLPDLAYCSDDLQNAGVYLREKERAIEKKYLGYNKKLMGSIILDLDYPSFYGWQDEGAPAPNYIVRNPENQHCHYIYALLYPVMKYDCKDTSPMRKFALASGALTDQLKADEMYSGYIAKSLWNKTWEATLVEPMAYTLDDLLNEIPDRFIKEAQARKRKKGTLDPLDYHSRNVWVFDNLRKHSYSYVRQCETLEEFYEGLFKKCLSLNSNFPPLCQHQEPMMMNELQNICWSIAKWVWRRFTNEEFSRIQSFRGSQKGKKKKSILLPRVMEMVAQGRSHRSIARELGISPSTITNWLKT